MRLASLWRSTPLRLAATFACIFVAAFLITGIVTYQLFKSELLQNLDRAITELHAAVASSYDVNDLEDLVSTVNTYSRLTSPRDRVFALVDPTGKLIAGNFQPNPMSDGISTSCGRLLGLKTGGDYRVISGPAGTSRLVIAESFVETDRLEDIAVRSFIWATIFIVFLAMAGGFYVATGAQRRLDGIAHAMNAVSHGKLDIRVPLKGNNDDIDTVSHQINEALDRLSTLVETMRQVSSDIAHELKTPLNRLKLQIEEAAADGSNGRDVGERLEGALAEADQINSTFEALLRISQIEAGARKTRFQTIDLADVLHTVAEIYANVAEDSGMTLVDAVGPIAPVKINGDRELLTQMFVNLVENAIRHCLPGTHIKLSLVISDGAAIASVRDDGPGIPAEEREKVFRRLYRLEKSRTTAGSGLGLSLVRAIADLHGGRVDLSDNRPGLLVAVAIAIQQA